MKLPKRYDARAAETRWQRRWAEQGLYRFDRFPDRPIYSIDTPPPTVSGAIHIGHVFSYMQAEIVARFWRLRGHNVYYPFGFDDNGLPSERLVEKEKGVKATEVGRERFVEMCLELTREYEKEFKAFWQTLGISCDWSEDYSTIDPRSQRISQRSFIDLYRKGRVYRKEAPTLWCPECHTAIAQAEIEDAEHASVFHDVAFGIDGRDLVISTTRPELIPACVGMFAHPDDDRYRGIVGRRATVPLFGYDVPIMADERADPEKGTGLVMCCTFGDTTDIAWWQEHGLPTRIVFGADGRMNENAPGYEDLSLKEARERIVEDLEDAGLLRGSRPITHTVNVHERCGTEIEFSVAAQWFVRILDIKDEIIRAGSEVEWCPDFMGIRFRNWVENLKWDWCVSRQRYYGVPFPLWTCAECGEVVLASEDQLPVDPATTSPPVDKCPKCGSVDLDPERDIMDTWMTSSCTPFINLRWREPDDRTARFGKAGGATSFLMDLRPQAHDIIRTWAYYTIVKSVLNEGKVPWRTAMISGHVLHPDREKLSKSKGPGAHSPAAVVEERSADVVRYWASSTRLGTDTMLVEEPLDAGHKLVVKLWTTTATLRGSFRSSTGGSSRDSREPRTARDRASRDASTTRPSRRPRRSSGETSATTTSRSRRSASTVTRGTTRPDVAGRSTRCTRHSWESSSSLRPSCRTSRRRSTRSSSRSGRAPSRSTSRRGRFTPGSGPTRPRRRPGNWRSPWSRACGRSSRPRRRRSPRRSARSRWRATPRCGRSLNRWRRSSARCPTPSASGIPRRPVSDSSRRTRRGLPSGPT
jgi:valyl-tRNA synthetase